MDDFDLFRDMFNEEIEDKITNGRQGKTYTRNQTVRQRDITEAQAQMRMHFHLQIGEMDIG